MKLLVTGAGGFLGRRLVESLLVHGERDLRLLVRPGSRRPDVEELTLRYPLAQIEICEGTLGDAADVKRALADVGYVYHLAAAKGGAVSEIFLHTVVGTKKLLDACIQRPVSERPAVLLVSSISVYASATLPRGTVIDERTPVEPRPELRDAYAYGKARQEALFHEYRERHGLGGVTARPGLIYGPGGTLVPTRVGLTLPGLFLHLGGDNQLPLTYVDNCADALVRIGRSTQSKDQIYNVIDDDLPTCREYLRLYKREARRVRSVGVPWPLTLALSHLSEQYNRSSRGQLPAILTPYRSRALWAGNRFDNGKLKALGWRPRISTDEGLRRTFAALDDETQDRAS
ncbi:MAG TPA: NAD-dependent epimerase/dehydratase family protein [Myxococcales bacterium]|nr:NAD-dependent epimerase/dehydratase family protein [Myxococcales bacterium]